MLNLIDFGKLENEINGKRFILGGMLENVTLIVEYSRELDFFNTRKIKQRICVIKILKCIINLITIF